MNRLPGKSPALLLLTLALAIALWIPVVRWQFAFSYEGALPLWASVINITLWFVLLLFGLYQIAVRTASAFLSPSESLRLLNVPADIEHAKVSFTLVYLTCNDFMPDCFTSIVRQKYSRFNVIVGDDSTDEAFIARIDSAVTVLRSEHDPGVDREFTPEISVRHWKGQESGALQTSNRNGKSDNLNRCIADHADRLNEWIVVLDADTTLPQNYLETLGEAASATLPQVGFIQGRNTSRFEFSSDGFRSFPTDQHSGGSAFQRLLAPELDFIYRGELPSRARFGFTPFMGHGGAIRKSALLFVEQGATRKTSNSGPFADVVSEDYGISVELRRRGFVGSYVEELSAHEQSPVDIDAYLTRVRKYSSGAAEALRRLALPFLMGTRGAHAVSLVERIDAVLLLSWAALAPLFVFNLFLSGIVAGTVWQETAMPLVHELLLYLISVLSLASLIVPFAGGRTIEGLSSSLSLVCVVLASAPIVAWSFLRGLFTKPRFVATPKRSISGDSKLAQRPDVALALLALSAAALAMWYWSPFSPVLLANAFAYASVPALRELGRTSLEKQPARHLLARLFVNLPGVLLVWGLYQMWDWQLRNI